MRAFWAFRWRCRATLVGFFIVALLVGLRLLSIQGFVRPVRLASGSMAPAYLGPHWEVTCGDCGYPVTIDALQAADSETVVCLNCGFAANELAEANQRPGERTLLDRGAWWLRSPRRFEAVAFRDPAIPERLTVKRCVGLPGEIVEIRGGELYVNDELVRKSLAELRRLAVPVHDDRFRPRDPRLPPRWRDAAGHWRSAKDGYIYPGDFQPLDALGADPQFEWLVYHHWRCSYLLGRRTTASPVLDDYGYNLGPPRQLNPVTDIMLRCRVQTAGEGCLAAALHDGQETWEVRLWPRRGAASLLRAGKPLVHGSFPGRRDEVPFVLEAAVCDRRVLAALDGRTLFAFPYEPPSSPDPSAHPVALGAAGLAVDVGELTVARDIYYLPPPGRGSWKLDRPLGENEYLVLGDNAPLALDSRTWTQPALPQKFLIGRVLRWPWVE